MPTICPEDCRPCCDDICRGTGVCGISGQSMFDTCNLCHAIYSEEFAIDCECSQHVDDDCLEDGMEEA